MNYIIPIQTFALFDRRQILAKLPSLPLDPRLANLAGLYTTVPSQTRDQFTRKGGGVLMALKSQKMPYLILEGTSLGAIYMRPEESQVFLGNTVRSS